LGCNQQPRKKKQKKKSLCSGKGIYFSEYTNYSMAYVRKGSKILLCQVLLGRPYRIDFNLGASLQPGYDSHISRVCLHAAVFKRI
jgi:hypothetical protein